MSHLREACPEVVVDVAGDPLPLLLQFPLPREPPPVSPPQGREEHRGHGRRRRRAAGGDEAGPLPEVGLDVERGRRPLHGVFPVEAGPDLERVASGGQATKDDPPRPSHGHPVVVG